MIPMLLAKFAARQAVQRHLVLNDVGLMMGVTILAKRVGDELRLDEKRVLTLLSVAHGRVPAQKTLNYIRNAEKHYQQGDALMCSMALALTGVHGFTHIEQARELFAAEEFLNTGGTEQELLKHCGIERVLDDPNASGLYKMLTKENPYHKPAGSPGGTGGQFTDAEGAGEGTASEAQKSWGRPHKLQEHFEEHGSDFGSKNAEEYANQASEFRNRAQSQGLSTKVDKYGVSRVYEPETNTFGAFNADGTTRTYFKPRGGADYFESQPGELNMRGGPEMPARGSIQPIVIEGGGGGGFSSPMTHEHLHPGDILE